MEISNAKESALPSLSSDIHVITAEINTYKRVAGEAIFEIGRRLKHVKENDLVHGQWERWCREEIDISPSQARMFIKVADEFGSNRCTFNDLGLRALYEIATLPPEERERPHTIPSTGEVKTVDEMTVRELREVKKALKEAERLAEEERRRAEKAEADYEAIRDTLESMREAPPDNERLRRYEDRFGDIDMYENGVRRIPNSTDISAAIQTFNYEVRTLLKKYAYLAQYAHEVSTLPRLVAQDYDSTLEALSGFVRSLRDDFDSARRGAQVININ